MPRPFLAACALVVISGACAAGDGGSTPIATDRPSVTDSSLVVPLGSLQFENGFTNTVNQGQSVWDGSETLLRLSVASKTELRLDAPNYFSPQFSPAGFGDSGLGIKQQLGPTPGGFDLSVVLSLSLPTGANAISSHGYDPSVQLPWSLALSSKWTAAGMLSVYWPTEGGRRNVTGETTFLIDRTLFSRWDAFAEYAGDFPELGAPRHLLHFGTSFRPTPHQQVDLHGGIGPSAATLEHFIGVGYSFRWQVWKR